MKYNFQTSRSICMQMSMSYMIIALGILLSVCSVVRGLCLYSTKLCYSKMLSVLFLMNFLVHCRIYRPGDCSSAMESQCSISNTFRGLNLLPGSKRKCPTQFNSSEENLELSDGLRRYVHLTPLKRLKESSVPTKSGVWESNAGTPFFNSPSDCREDANLHNSRGCLQNSPCIVEDSLAKGFEGCISMKCSF
uniref:Uncharacterized protein n=1 Tax=Avena sativa TaxID=4498 RepID=A0ACD5WQB7_AVESA